jgi:hypothetical protein
LEDGLPLLLPDTADMEYIYVITGFLTIAFAIAGLVLACYLERRWLNSRKTGPDKSAPSSLSVDGLST